MFFEHALNEIRKSVWCAAEAWDAAFGEFSCNALVESRDAAVGQGQQGDDAHTGRHHAVHAADELGLIAPFDEVADEKENSLAWIGDKFFAIGDRLVDVGTTAE